MEKSNLGTINKDRLTAFLEHLKNKNKNPDEIFSNCVVSSIY